MGRQRFEPVAANEHKCGTLTMSNVNQHASKGNYLLPLVGSRRTANRSVAGDPSPHTL